MKRAYAGDTSIQEPLEKKQRIEKEEKLELVDDVIPIIGKRILLLEMNNMFINNGIEDVISADRITYEIFGVCWKIYIHYDNRYDSTHLLTRRNKINYTMYKNIYRTVEHIIFCSRNKFTEITCGEEEREEKDYSFISILKYWLVKQIKL